LGNGRGAGRAANSLRPGGWHRHHFRGRFRFTADIDFLLEVPQLVLPGLLDELEARGFSFDQHTVIREWVQDHLTALNFGDVIVDWLKPVVPCFKHVLDAATLVDWRGRSLRIATAEGLIVMKLLSFRTRDQDDLETLLVANHGSLNLDWVRQEWAGVGDADDPRMIRFEEMVVNYYRASPPNS
jgi:hypothetical protein